MWLSIVIPMFKVEAYIERCLLSCINQDIPCSEYEIICVDDGSPDRSRELALRFAEEQPNIKVISQINQGLSVARNTGIDNSIGDYVLFLDSDDWIASNCLGKLANICNDNNLDLLQISAANVFENNVVRRFVLTEGAIRTGKECLLAGIPICAPFTIYNREFLNRHSLRFYPGIFHEDNEFSPRVYYYAQRVGAINDIIYYVYQNPQSITRTINPKKAFDALIVMERLHDFSKTIKDYSLQAFHFKISEVLNVALNDILYCEKDDLEEFNKVLYDKRYLLFHLRDSKILRFYIEWILFRINSRHIIETYKFCLKLDYRKF